MNRALVIIAVLCFAFSAVGIGLGAVNLVALGLACLAGAQLV